MAMTVLMALGTALVLMTSTDTVIAANFRSSREAFYAAEAVAELAVAELRTSVNWTPFVEGAERSRFVDGAPGGPRRFRATRRSTSRRSPTWPRGAGSCGGAPLAAVRL
jgi:hypothetical protein